MLRLFLFYCYVLTQVGCADMAKYVSEMDLSAGGSMDPNNNGQVTIGGKFYFREPKAKRLPNYSKDK